MEGRGNAFTRYWLNNSLRDFTVAVGAIAVAFNIVGALSKNPALEQIGDMIALFDIFHYLIHGFFYRQQRFLVDNQRTYSLPKKKIKGTSIKYLLSLLVATVLGITLVKELYSGTLYGKLKAMFMYLIAKVLGGIIGTGGLKGDGIAERDNFTLVGNMNQIAAKSDSVWDQILNMVQTILIILGVILVIVLAVAAIVSYVRKLVGKAGSSEEIRSGREVSDRESALGEGRKREKLLDFSPNAKVRKIYKKEINRKRRKGLVIPNYLTPGEIEQLVAPEGNAVKAELHALYEKARYSEEGCSDADAQRMKSLKL